MHFEVLVEDASGKIALEYILEKILGPNNSKHSWRLHGYKGIGRIPKNLQNIPDPNNRMLLNNLPSILRGYGKSLQHDCAVVIVVVDLDDKDCTTFKSDLLAILDTCDPKPNALFRIAIEEGEAWLLGDQSAVRKAYPKAKTNVLNSYTQDSICGTWEKLADAIHTGGAQKLRRDGWPNVGQAKCEWARNIAPHMDVNINISPSFQAFRDGVRRLAEILE